MSASGRHFAAFNCGTADMFACLFSKGHVLSHRTLEVEQKQLEATRCAQEELKSAMEADQQAAIQSHQRADTRAAELVRQEARLMALNEVARGNALSFCCPVPPHRHGAMTATALRRHSSSEKSCSARARRLQSSLQRWARIC